MSSSRINDDTYVPLDIFETRIHELESKIAGKTNLYDVNFSKIKPILSSLHEVDTVLISNISGRKKIHSLLKRVDTLQKILDPSYLDSIYNTEAKIEAIVESENEIQKYVEKFNKLEEVNTALNNETMLKLPNLTDKITTLTSNLLINKKQCDKQALEIIQLTQDYKDCMNHVSDLMVELDTTLTRFEKEAEPKAVLD